MCIISLIATWKLVLKYWNKSSEIISRTADLNYFSGNHKTYVNIDLYKYIFLISKQLENETFIFLTLYSVSAVSQEYPPIK